MTEIEWSAANSDMYRQLANVAVPDRAGQIAALLTLMPFGTDDSFRVVELASGEGILAEAILRAYPRASLLALDGEPTMRAAASARLAPLADRARVDAFDLAAPDWYALMDGTNVVVSSLCVHHLTGEGKRQLFAAVRQRLSPQGALLLADLILPARDEARRLFAATWDRSAEAQSQALTGNADLFGVFQRETWNYFTYPDDYDKPSSLADQLIWLREAGFAVADCFWLQAGHAIYGGYVSATSRALARPLAFSDALAAARAALGQRV